MLPGVKIDPLISKKILKIKRRLNVRDNLYEYLVSKYRLGKFYFFKISFSIFFCFLTELFIYEFKISVFFCGMLSVSNAKVLKLKLLTTLRNYIFHKVSNMAGNI